MRAVLQSAVLWVVLLTFCGCLLILAGLYRLVGAGPTLIMGGLMLLATAGTIRQGLIAHG